MDEQNDIFPKMRLWDNMDKFGSWGAGLGAVIGASTPIIVAWAVVQADPYDYSIWNLAIYLLLPSALLGYIVFGISGLALGAMWSFLSGAFTPAKIEHPMANT